MPGEAIDVVVPTVGRWDYLHETLDSIEAQQGVSAHPIVVNDSGGPVPTTIEARATVVNTAGRIGEGGARSLGAAHAASNRVAFCDDDDHWGPGKLLRQTSALGASTGWCLTGAVRVDEQGREVAAWDLAALVREQRNGMFERRILTHNPVPAGPSSLLISAELLHQVGGWRESMSYFADWDLWIRLARAIDPVLVDEPLVRYRVWDGQMVTDRRQGWAALDEIRTRYADRRDELGVGPLDDRVIAWILQGELATEGRKVAGLREAVKRAAPRKLSDLRAIGRYGRELWQTTRR